MRLKEFNQSITEAPLPADWDASQFANRTSFKNRLAYALARAAQLGTGSSRVAMTIEYEGRPTALKVAKNNKGIAQNAAEAAILSDGYIIDLGIAIPLIDYDRDNVRPTWIQTEVAQRTNEGQLCAIMGCETLYTLVSLAYNISGNPRFPNSTPDNIANIMRNDNRDEEDIETLMDWAHNLAVLSTGYDIELADFANPANWGIYNGKPVIIDMGLSKQVWATHYKKK